jgi:hypothetical protein
MTSFHILVITVKHGTKYNKTVSGLLYDKCGCILCARESFAIKNMKSKEKFIEDSKKIHGDEYDYSLVDYKGSFKNVKIICKKHGIFEQYPSNHLCNSKCPNCMKDKSKSINNNFVKRAKLVHPNDNYDYSLSNVNYKNNKQKIKIICNKHGVFEQSANSHLKGRGCPTCYRTIKKTLQDFINKANYVHDNKYDYSLVDYKGSNKKVKIICKKHGLFEQLSVNHLRGIGCPNCHSTISHGHVEIADYIKSLGFSVINNNRSFINPYELDILINNTNLAIEFHGIYYHSYDKKELPVQKNKHFNKFLLCKDKNLQLLQIFEHEWNKKPEIVKSMIKSKLKLNKKVNARQCTIKCLSVKEFSNFMNKNHLQGSCGSSINYGLEYNNEIVCAIGFNIKNQCEITRFANKLYVNVIGGAGRLLSHFIKTYNPKTIMTYANLRYSKGDLYEKLGFKFIKYTKPNYFYTKSSKTYSRLKFQKHKLKKLLTKYDENLSEPQNMFNNGYRRIWDAGNAKFIKELNTEST